MDPSNGSPDTANFKDVMGQFVDSFDDGGMLNTSIIPEINDVSNDSKSQIHRLLNVPEGKTDVLSTFFGAFHDANAKAMATSPVGVFVKLGLASALKDQQIAAKPFFSAASAVYICAYNQSFAELRRKKPTISESDFMEAWAACNDFAPYTRDSSKTKMRRIPQYVLKALNATSESDRQATIETLACKLCESKTPVIIKSYVDSINNFSQDMILNGLFPHSPTKPTGVAREGFVFVHDDAEMHNIEEGEEGSVGARQEFLQSDRQALSHMGLTEKSMGLSSEPVLEEKDIATASLTSEQPPPEQPPPEQPPAEKPPAEQPPVEPSQLPAPNPPLARSSTLRQFLKLV